MGIIHIVEDNHEVLHIIMKFLVLLGYQVQGFSSAETYLSYMQKTSFKPPLLILSDVNMPGMSGLQLAYKVRKKHPDIRYMLMTANTEQLEGSVLSDLNIDNVFEKPFSFTKLEQVLNAI